MMHHSKFFQLLGKSFGCSVLAMEYPGYSFFSHEIKNGQRTAKKVSASPSGISANIVSVYKHVTMPKNLGGLGFQESEVIIYGKSIGSGPSTLLASKFTPRALIL